jgi:signal transduction histidine kinase
MPAKVRTKLLAAFLGIVVLFVVIGILARGVLSDSNSRVERLGAVQQRASAYRGLQTEADQVRVLLGIHAGSSVYVVGGGDASSVPSGPDMVPVDDTIRSTLDQLGQAATVTALGFTPPADEGRNLRQIRSDDLRFSDLIGTIRRLDNADAPSEDLVPPLADAERLAKNLGSLTSRLVNIAQGKTDSLIAENREAFASSQTLFIGVGAGSIALALLLGLVLSLSLIEPIQRVEARMAAIASGDFSGHVNVPNRDELGVLAANVNRMNDELGGLYEQLEQKGQELETVSRHKSEFLANMSHELRTPLNAIIGFSEVLHERMFGELNEQQMGYVGDILESGQHLLSLINDILDLSKVEAGRMELELSDVSLPLALQTGLTMQGERAGKTGITLGLSVDPDDLVVRADERKLRQVVFNLLSNAVKFTPPGGRIDVSARLTDGVVEVVVTDSGSGIAPEDQELIFEEFKQARGDPGTRQEGTGLGLPLSRRFVELHGGRLWVESEQGVGSTFRFTLPVRERM